MSILVQRSTKTYTINREPPFVFRSRLKISIKFYLKPYINIEKRRPPNFEPAHFDIRTLQLKRCLSQAQIC